MSFLDRFIPDPTTQTILAQFVGYILARHLKLEKTLILLGPGANGKSTLMDIISHLLGMENVTSYSISELTDTQGYHRYGIKDALMNWYGELDSGKINTTLFK